MSVCVFVNVCCKHAHSAHTRALPADTHAPGPAAIQSAVDWTVGELKAGREVYIHCAHGHGRSATVLAAVLIATKQAAGPEEAVKLMR